MRLKRLKPGLSIVSIARFACGAYTLHKNPSLRQSVGVTNAVIRIEQPGRRAVDPALEPGPRVM
jgi:hypothetical protein